MTAHACVALPFGTRALSDEAAALLLGQLIAGDSAIRLLQNEAHWAAWFAALETTARGDLTHPLLAGRCVRILTEHDHWPLGSV